VIQSGLSVVEDGDGGRVVWRSRRGLLELDLRLVPFASERYPRLTAEARQAYRALLEEDDPDVLAWLTGREAAPPALAEIVALVVAHARG
jgi:antitoxin CptB